MLKFSRAFLNIRGTTLVMTLVFLSILSIISTSIVGLVIAENKLAKLRLTEEYSFQVAESGLQYARWRMAHNESDFTGATQTLTDFAGGEVGSYTLTFTTPAGGDSRISITSKGWYKDATNLYRTVTAKYGKMAFTYYSFLFDEGAWFGIPTVDGRVHSNGGIRMDGTVNSLVTSAVSSYTCTQVHGCNTNETKAGVWGAGGNQSLWTYPVVPIDFNSVITNLEDLHELAEDMGVGLFLSKNATPKGYELNFLADGTVEVYKVESLENPVSHRRWVNGLWKNYTNSLDIDDAELLQVYTLQQPSDFIFAESDVWVRGTVKGRVTVVAAEIPQESANYQDIVISDNVVYNTYDGSAVLGLIAKGNVLIALKVPDDLRVDGVLMAQTGIVGRDYYESGPQTNPYYLRTSITTYGSIISKGFSDPQFRWIDPDLNVVSGFVTSTNIYDPNIAFNAPPYFPTVGVADFMDWEEKAKGT